MKVLVLGGTRFVGKVFVEHAMALGHQVTTFNRGRTGQDVPGVEVVRGDRENVAELASLVSGRDWDWVVDSSGYVPQVVGSAARLLSDRAAAFVFLSTISVYPAWPDEPVDEDSDTYDCPPDAPGTAKDEANWTAAQYGAYKAGCERAVQEAFAGRVTVLRPGVILGPQENVGRLTWWLRRIAQGGRVLAPGRSAKPIQPVDIRDLIAFTVSCLEGGTTGTFNVTAPRGHATFGGMLEACRTATGSQAKLTWVDDDFLVGRNVRQWTELPLWRTPPGTWAVQAAKAGAAGLSCRPVQATVQDTHVWLTKSGGPLAYDRQAHHGLSAQRERVLLEAWDQRPGNAPNMVVGEGDSNPSA
ncbi:NAD-dependent epimerase/dehydratase family protein [Microbispora sp. NPDC049125]|uniref:NAD-dependent epimerase/dehydratase family protein n=1 Tax=Microbispora sp. NPDC049125 TaxID=3154929 RepID=UPI003465E116